MKMQYTEEQIARANQTDLVSFLNEQGEQLVNLRSHAGIYYRSF